LGAVTASALTMAHPELWFFLAPAEEGKEFEFGHMEEVRHGRCPATLALCVLGVHE